MGCAGNDGVATGCPDGLWPGSGPPELYGRLPKDPDCHQYNMYGTGRWSPPAIY